MEVLFGVQDWVDETLVFVTPHDEVEEVLNKVFRKVIGLRVAVMVLMDGDEVEPFVLVEFRAHEFDLIVSKGSVESLVTHVGEAIQGELCCAFLQQDRSDDDVVRFWDSSIIV